MRWDQCRVRSSRSRNLVLTALIHSLCIGVAHSGGGDSAYSYPLDSDSWVATDALGRELPGYEECGPIRKGKFVGLFYFLWLGHHTNEYGTGGPFDITKIEAKNPENPNYAPMGVYHHWGESEDGYYLTKDPYILRKHAAMLAEAGVDVLIFDVSNSATRTDFIYLEECIQLCKVFTRMRESGLQTPQIAFLAPFGDSSKPVARLYSDFYLKGLYKDLWFYWKGKPLIMADPDKSAAPARDFFTFRKGQPDYFKGPTGPNQWGWSEISPQHVFYNQDNEPEQMVVTVGVNAVKGITDHPMVMSAPQGAMGRSWHKGNKDESEGAINWGFHFQEQWDRALQEDPEFVFITGWNEWVMVRIPAWPKVPEGHPVFCDAYTQEYSRDIEPMKGGHGDSYYYQMVSNIRKFKGVGQPPKASPPRVIKIDGHFEDWIDVQPEYKDVVGDAVKRDYPGWGDLHYKNDTGRNDIIKSMVTYDIDNIYFYVETKDKLTSHEDDNWMLLFIDSDQDHKTGWEGYDFLVNSQVIDSSITTVKRTSEGCTWADSVQVAYQASHKRIELAIPRSLIGQGKGSSRVSFDFHWADNIQKRRDIVEFSVSGDSAPDRRFNYRFEVPAE